MPLSYRPLLRPRRVTKIKADLSLSSYSFYFCQILYYRIRICKLMRSTGIDSLESIPELFKQPVYKFGLWRAGMINSVVELRPNFKTFKEPRIDSKELTLPAYVLCSLAGRYDNPLPSRLLAPLECFKILALACHAT